jgi:hypothetical protein
VGVRRREVLNGSAGVTRVGLAVASTVAASSTAWPQEEQNLAVSGISTWQREQITTGILLGQVGRVGQVGQVGRLSSIFLTRNTLFCDSPRMVRCEATHSLEMHMRSSIGTVWSAGVALAAGAIVTGLAQQPASRTAPAPV